jgi:hypothetical protein
LQAPANRGAGEALLWLYTGQQILQERHAPACGCVAEVGRALRHGKLQQLLKLFTPVQWTTLTGLMD